MTKSTQTDDQNVSDALKRWDTSNVLEMEEAIIKEVNGKVVEKREVDEYKDGKATGNKVTIYLFNLEIGKQTKEAKFGAQSMSSCIQRFGADASKWRQKKVVAIHAKVGNNPYIIWKPAGKLDSE